MVQSKTKAQSVKKFRVRMITEQYGAVSAALSALIDFYDDSGTHVATLETDRYGKSNLITIDSKQKETTAPLVFGMSGNGYSFSFTRIGTRIAVLTDFGVEIIQNGIEIRVRIPDPIYSDKVEGLCGNSDGDKENDYQKPDGTVLAYTPLGGYTRSDSEFECAKSWIVSEGIGRKKRSTSSEGPHPGSVTCIDKTIIAECDVLLDPSWLSICEPLVSADRRAQLIKACKTDYCMLKEPKTKLDIISQYVIECQGMAEETVLCDWEVQATGKQPVCGSNEEYKGCATMCDLRSCDDYRTNKGCNSKANTFSSCVCKKDFYLLNGVCVAAGDCSVTGWTDWSEWSTCSNPCGGSRRRLQICQGEDCATNSQSEEEACSNDDCNPCIKANCHTDATCNNKDGVAVCECNDGFGGDGTTCSSTGNLN